MFTFINRLTVTGDVAEFERHLSQITDYMTQQPGFRSYRLYHSAADADVYVEIAEWDSPQDHQKALSGEGFQRPVQQVMKHATAQPAPFTLVTDR